jgi:hypothetical protein
MPMGVLNMTEAEEAKGMISSLEIPPVYFGRFVEIR